MIWRALVLGMAVGLATAPLCVAQEDLESELVQVAGLGEWAVVQDLLGQGVNPNAISVKGDTPLLAASLNGHVEIAQLLLDWGADPNGQGLEGVFPLLGAVMQGHVDIVELLLDRGADVQLQTETGITAYAAVQRIAASSPRLQARFKRIMKLLEKAGAS